MSRLLGGTIRHQTRAARVAAAMIAAESPLMLLLLLLWHGPNPLKQDEL
jgi:hypothetical protein